jgi:hypothetical protein
MSAFSTNKSVTLQPQNTADAGIGTETERRFLIGLNCDWTVKADLEIGAPVSPFNPARPFYPHYHRCSEPWEKITGTGQLGSQLPKYRTLFTSLPVVTFPGRRKVGIEFDTSTDAHGQFAFRGTLHENIRKFNENIRSIRFSTGLIIGQLRLLMALCWRKTWGRRFLWIWRGLLIYAEGAIGWVNYLRRRKPRSRLRT